MIDHLKDTYLPLVLSRLESRNFHCERGSWPVLDYGNYKDGGHLEEKHLEYLRPFLEQLGWTPKEAAKSGNVWMAGIIAYGCAAAIRFMDVDESLKKRLWAQMEVAAAFIVYQGTKEAWDVSKAAMRTPAPGHLWDDVAPGQKVEGPLHESDLPVMFGWGESDADGVGIRFTASGLLAYESLANRVDGDAAWAVAGCISKAANKDKASMRRWQMETWVGTAEWRP